MQEEEKVPNLHEGDRLKDIVSEGNSRKTAVLVCRFAANLLVCVVTCNSTAQLKDFFILVTEQKIVQAKLTLNSVVCCEDNVHRHRQLHLGLGTPIRPASRFAWKMQMQNKLTMQPKSSFVNRFNNFCKKYFKGTVFSAECSSWYKPGKESRVTVPWLGSRLHAVQALDQVRWE